MDEIMTNRIATRPASASELLDQIGRWTLVEINARDIIDLGDGIHCFVGKGRSRKLVVKLAANDTYAVELVRFNRADFTFTSERFLEGIYGDQLREVVERMVAR